MIAGSFSQIRYISARDHDRRPECLNLICRHSGIKRERAGKRASCGRPIAPSEPLAPSANAARSATNALTSNKARKADNTPSLKFLALRSDDIDAPSLPQRGAPDDALDDVLDDVGAMTTPLRSRLLASGGAPTGFSHWA